MARTKTRGPAVPKPAPVISEAIQPDAPAIELAVPAIEPAVPMIPTTEPAVEPVPASDPIAAILPSAAQVRTAASAEKDVIMDTTTVTEKTQAMFADLSTRAKGAMEKSAAAFEDANAFAKGNIEAIVESSKIAAKAFETVGQDVAEYAKSSFESSAAAFKTLASATSPTEFFKLQSDYARTAFDTMIAQSARSTEKMLKLAGEIAQPISNRVAVATDKIKSAA